MTWEICSRSIGREGTTITYIPRWKPESGWKIESRKRHIPHANGSGTWDHTSYFILKDGKEVLEKNTLKAAKEYAEMQINDEVKDAKM